MQDSPVPAQAWQVPQATAELSHIAWSVPQNAPWLQKSPGNPHGLHTPPRHTPLPQQCAVPAQASPSATQLVSSH
jgi:hypothetical protein